MFLVTIRLICLNDINKHKVTIRLKLRSTAQLSNYKHVINKFSADICYSWPKLTNEAGASL